MSTQALWLNREVDRCECTASYNLCAAVHYSVFTENNQSKSEAFLQLGSVYTFVHPSVRAI